MILHLLFSPSSESSSATTVETSPTSESPPTGKDGQSLQECVDEDCFVFSRARSSRAHRGSGVFPCPGRDAISLPPWGRCQAHPSHRMVLLPTAAQYLKGLWLSQRLPSVISGGRCALSGLKCMQGMHHWWVPSSCSVRQHLLLRAARLNVGSCSAGRDVCH